MIYPQIENSPNGTLWALCWPKCASGPNGVSVFRVDDDMLAVAWTTGSEPKQLQKYGHHFRSDLTVLEITEDQVEAWKMAYAIAPEAFLAMVRALKETDHADTDQLSHHDHP